ncbi:15-hydroxyprostaglandin dehydrogenase [Diaporthe helianthi]|uniref:15-hydroxyprostaglandin dehydrogenase n=1 Tax=Diaporthe helianthi TaxID=158607 RepID=A0A2P5HNW1_DIAHE|nr:15-hydroxyprostaglandin dehydrogenase [Diaporthe helianthi]
MASTVPAERKVVVITGSTSGIGQHLAEHLHPKGYNIVVSGRRTKEGQALATQLDPTGETAIFIQCDVTSYTSQANLLKTAWAKWNRLDAFIANAGIVDQGSAVPPEPDLSCTDVDVKGVIYGTVLAVHYMRHNDPAHGKGGRIIVTGSIASLWPFPILPEYGAAKAAAAHWVRTVAPVSALEGITVNCVLPNAYDTSIMPGFEDAFLEEHLTTKECLMAAYEVFLDDAAGEKTGKVLETAYKSHYYHDEPPYKSGGVIERTIRVYEPWFIGIHGKESGLSDSIKESPRKTSK